MKKCIPVLFYFSWLISISMVPCYKVLAQASSIPTINQQQAHTLTSDINETTYHLNISLPQNYSENDTIHYPVLFILDGGLGFPVAHAARSSMDLFGGLEDVIIVGVEYDWEKSYAPWYTNRWTDYTPSTDTLVDVNPAYRSLLNLPEGTLRSGGASIFLNVLEDEIIPFLDDEYKTTADRGISGHSLGGLFVSYCLFSETKLFTRYGINSPSLWWDRKFIFNMENLYSEEHSELKAKVFLSVGSLEGKSMTPVVKEFGEKIRARDYSGLELTIHVFEDETHTSVVPAMISRTIRVLYAPDNR